MILNILHISLQEYLLLSLKNYTTRLNDMLNTQSIQHLPGLAEIVRIFPPIYNIR